MLSQRVFAGVEQLLADQGLGEGARTFGRHGFGAGRTVIRGEVNDGRRSAFAAFAAFVTNALRGLHGERRKAATSSV